MKALLCISKKIHDILINTSTKKMTKITAFAFLAALVTTMLIPVNSYALDKAGNVKWQLIFLSPYGGCTNYQYQMTNTYDEITTKYFELYQFENSKYSPQCMPDKKYTYYQAPADLDLIILVYDNEIGKKELHSNEIGGLYNHVGADMSRNHSIIICDCSNFGFSDPVWTLSHELSHFVTNYLGFDQSVIETQIHTYDSKFDQCTEGNRDDTCTSITSHVYGDYYFGKATVMIPYQPAIGKKAFSSDNQTILNDTSDADKSQVIMNMQKEITKWWLAGLINNTQYTKTLGYMVGNEGGLAKNDIIMNNVILEDGSDGKEQKPIFYDTESEKTIKELSLLKRIPFKQENMTNSSEIMPEWFKSKAYLWSQDQSTSDQDFLKAVQHLVTEAKNSTQK
jgi:hypothetical protein